MNSSVSDHAKDSRAAPEPGAGIVRALSRFPEVQAIYLFGSVAAGTAAKNSDIDVAVGWR